MKLSKFSFIIATLAFILVTGTISYASFKSSVNSPPIADISPNVIAETSPTLIPVNTVAPQVTLTPKVNIPPPTSVPQVVAPTADNRCIIVVDGQRYDVTVFRNQHSGGNIFSCGTDMSSILHQQHNQRYIQMMAPYRI